MQIPYFGTDPLGVVQSVFEVLVFVTLIGIHTFLLGRDAEAQISAARVMQMQPELTIESYIRMSPGGASGLVEKFASALHKAGIPRSSGSTTA